MARRASGRSARRKAKKIKGAVDQRAMNARHEAAHAVVASRLGFPLLFTTIEPDAAPMRPMEHLGPLPPGYDAWRSLGFTTLAEGTVEGWVAILPQEDARGKLEGFAAQNAAGIVAEESLGGSLYGPECRDDLVGVVSVAHALGIGNSTNLPGVQAFIGKAHYRATEILLSDAAAGWNRVGEALFHKGRLSGEEVAEILAQVEKEESNA